MENQNQFVYKKYSVVKIVFFIRILNFNKNLLHHEKNKSLFCVSFCFSTE